MPNRATPPFLLIPGLWLGAWAWDDVVDRLANHGVWAEGVTLPGLESRESDRSGITLEDHIIHVVAQVERMVADRDNRTGKVGLVAHSTGAMVAYGALDRVADRVAGIFYIDAFPVSSGTALRPTLPLEEVELAPPAWDELLVAEDGTEVLGEREHRLWEELAVPHPAGPVRQKLELRSSARWAVPSVVVACTMTGREIQTLTAAGSPVFAELAKTVPAYRELPGGGHWPMMTKPAELADLLIDAILVAQGASGTAADGNRA